LLQDKIGWRRTRLNFLVYNYCVRFASLGQAFYLLFLLDFASEQALRSEILTNKKIDFFSSNFPKSKAVAVQWALTFSFVINVSGLRSVGQAFPLLLWLNFASEQALR
jgi:hypothetical protein